MPSLRLAILLLIFLTRFAPTGLAQQQPLLPLPTGGPPPLLAEASGAGPAGGGQGAGAQGTGAAAPAGAVAANDGPSSSLFDNAPPNPAASLIPTGPTPNATVNLIRILVKKKVLTEAEAAEMIQQAEAEAAQASAQAAAQAAGVSGPDSDGAVRVTYIPEVVKEQIRDELKQEVLAEAKQQGWAAPKQVPDWSKRIKLFGDVRVRYQGTYFPTGNDNTGAFPIFNTINTGQPFDVSGTTFSPQYNVDQDRNALRLRARIGADANLENGWFAGIRIATGQSSEPVSMNQTLGLANNGQGGNFSKYAIWLDRGFIRYDIGGGLSYTEKTEVDADGKTHTVAVPHESAGQLSLFFGRFDNPFFSTSEMIWDEDVGFDGLALRARYHGEHLSPFLVGGAFPVFNTDFNFSTIQPVKYESTDKWLYAVQLGTDLKISRHVDSTFAGAYYYFDGVEGRLSNPYIPLGPQDQSNTDDTRQSFAQRGNTYRPVRNIIPDALNNYGTTNQYQYFGLATPFEVLALSGRINLNYFEPVQISLLGEFAKNLAWDKESINQVAVNNRGPLPAAPPAAPDTSGSGTSSTAPAPVGSYIGGDTAWNVALMVGKPVFEKAGDWSLTFGYRYIESDAVIDAFTDSDFAGGATNVKGYTVAGSLALSPNVKFGVRWMGANQIAGPPLKSDVLLIDLTAKF